MQSDDPMDAVRMAGVAAGAGALARLALALHGGERRAIHLSIEALLGSVLGSMGAGAIVYWDPDLQAAGWAWLIVGAGSGFCAVTGTRLIDLGVDWLRRRASA